MFNFFSRSDRIPSTGIWKKAIGRPCRTCAPKHYSCPSHIRYVTWITYIFPLSSAAGGSSQATANSCWGNGRHSMRNVWKFRTYWFTRNMVKTNLCLCDCRGYIDYIPLSNLMGERFKPHIYYIPLGLQKNYCSTWNACQRCAYVRIGTVTFLHLLCFLANFRTQWEQVTALQFLIDSQCYTYSNTGCQLLEARLWSTSWLLNAAHYRERHLLPHQLPAPEARESTNGATKHSTLLHFLHG